VGEAGHLNSHQRDTLAQIFRHPSSHNIEWHSILALLQAVATVRETQEGHVVATMGDALETFDPRREKDIDSAQLSNLRRFLRAGGYGPGEVPA
jgi:hypothetical protein